MCSFVPFVLNSFPRLRAEAREHRKCIRREKADATPDAFIDILDSHFRLLSKASVKGKKNKNPFIRSGTKGQLRGTTLVAVTQNDILRYRHSVCCNGRSRR